MMNSKEIKILLVDDEPDILELISYNLTKEGYRVFTAKNGAEAIKKAQKEVPHLILMDVMMPEMDGIEACEIIRQKNELSSTLIAFLSARGEDFSLLAGLNAGADDYITKPIKPKVLVSKIKALLRRSTMLNIKNIMHLGNIQIDYEAYKIFEKDREIELPRKEFELLSLLASRPGKVFKRDEILEKVWGNETIVGGRTIDVHIRKLREKLGEHYFITIKGVGYKFVSVNDKF